MTPDGNRTRDLRYRSQVLTIIIHNSHQHTQSSVTYTIFNSNNIKNALTSCKIISNTNHKGKQHSQKYIGKHQPNPPNRDVGRAFDTNFTNKMYLQPCNSRLRNLSLHKTATTALPGRATGAHRTLATISIRACHVTITYFLEYENNFFYLPN